MSPSDGALSRGRSGTADADGVQHLPNGKVRFHSKTSFHGAGWVFSVYDVDESGGASRKVPHESIEATHRIFVHADGCRWVYEFRQDEGRTLLAAELERQIDVARYVNGDAVRADPR